MKWTIGTKIGLGYALALAILVVIGAAILRSTYRNIQTQQFVGDTRAFLDQLQDVTQVMLEMQSNIRGYVLVGEAALLDEYRAADSRVDQEVAEVKIWIQNDPRYTRQLAAIEQFARQGVDFYQQVVAARLDPQKGPEAARALIASLQGQKLVDGVIRAVREIQIAERGVLKQRSDAASASGRAALLTINVATAIGLVFLTLAGIVVTRNISKPLKEVAAVAERIAGGDLTVKLSISHRQDEVGALMRAFRGMTDNLRRVTGEIQEGANLLGMSASEIFASTTQVASAAAQAATTVSQTSATAEEVRQTAQISAEKAHFVSDTAEKSAQISQAGKKSVDQVVAGMNRIRDQMESIAESIVILSEQTQTIGQIIATVEDLAAQSNLLAVNAAIEAAKAGEQGRGFAVVAQEVKSLAEQSKQATDQVRLILNHIQKATRAAVVAAEHGSKAVEAGVEQSAQAGQSIQTLAARVAEAAQATAQIAASTQQELVGVEQVASAMEGIKQASVQNVDCAKQLEIAAGNLKELGEKLKELVKRYKV